MTKLEFRKNVPGLIRHLSSGVQYLEAIEGSDRVFACYRGEDNTASFGCHAETWSDLLVNMQKALNDNSDSLDDPPFQIPN
ncbi:MAG: hypothetical protein ABJF04_06335 [Reichenbachiella sp.]|uniref:hypothetical protein n=1 Tax=Reichenbachiella sp. TaxID=2184521 RepID=UPI00326756BF